MGDEKKPLGRHATIDERLQVIEAWIGSAELFLPERLRGAWARTLAGVMKDADERQAHAASQDNVYTASGTGLEALAQRLGLERESYGFGQCETDVQLRERLIGWYQTSRRIAGEVGPGDPAFERPVSGVPNTMKRERENERQRIAVALGEMFDLRVIGSRDRDQILGDVVAVATEIEWDANGKPSVTVRTTSGIEGTVTSTSTSLKDEQPKKCEHRHTKVRGLVGESKLATVCVDCEHVIAVSPKHPWIEGREGNEIDVRDWIAALGRVVARAIDGDRNIFLTHTLTNDEAEAFEKAMAKSELLKAVFEQIRGAQARRMERATDCDVLNSVRTALCTQPDRSIIEDAREKRMNSDSLIMLRSQLFAGIENTEQSREAMYARVRELLDMEEALFPTGRPSRKARLQRFKLTFREKRDASDPVRGSELVLYRDAYTLRDAIASARSAAPEDAWAFERSLCGAVDDDEKGT